MELDDDIVRFFKNGGIDPNFLIDYRELVFEKKIGEGGYGEVFLGNWLC